jgi:putative membrane protein
MSTTSPEYARRLHPAGIAILAIRALRGLALPLGIAFAGSLMGSGSGEPVWRILAFGLLGALIAVVAGVAGWLTTRWSLTDGTVRLREGVLARKETVVPLARVQAVDTVHGPLQRLFGVQGVDVQTAGGGREGEIKLPAVARADVERLRAAVHDRTAGAPAEPVVLAERRLAPRRLAVAALTAGQVGVLLPVLAGGVQLVQELGTGAAEESLRLAPDTTGEWLLAALALFALAWLLSAAGAVLAFAGFTICREPDRLRIRRGLLARREATVPLARVHAVRVVEGTLRRPFGLATLRAEVLGYKREESAARTLFPLLRRAEVEPFLAALLPELADGLDGLAGPPRCALRRYVLPPALGALAVAAAAAVVTPVAGAWALLLVAAAVAYGRARFAAAGWRLRDDGRLALRFRRLARTTVLAPAARLQEHGTAQNPFQRRAGLADIEVRVGAGTHAAVRHLEERDAGRLFDRLRRVDT